MQSPRSAVLSLRCIRLRDPSWPSRDTHSLRPVRAFLIVPCILRNCPIFRDSCESRKKFEHAWGDNSRSEFRRSKTEICPKTPD